MSFLKFTTFQQLFLYEGTPLRWNMTTANNKLFWLEEHTLIGHSVSELTCQWSERKRSLWFLSLLLCKWAHRNWRIGGLLDPNSTSTSKVKNEASPLYIGKTRKGHCNTDAWKWPKDESAKDVLSHLGPIIYLFFAVVKVIKVANLFWGFTIPPSSRIVVAEKKENVLDWTGWKLLIGIYNPAQKGFTFCTSLFGALSFWPF